MMTGFRSRRWHCILAAICVVTLGASVLTAAAETYVQATIGPHSQLRIVTASGKTILPKRLNRNDVFGQQVGFESVAISPDRRVVGWIALYNNCCTSYLIPLALVLYSDGRTLTLTGRGLPIFQWCFRDNGRQVAFEQEMLHGWEGVHYELHEVNSGRLVSEYTPTLDRESTEEVGVEPLWVHDLKSRP